MGRFGPFFWFQEGLNANRNLKRAVDMGYQDIADPRSLFVYHDLFILVIHQLRQV